MPVFQETADNYSSFLYLREDADKDGSVAGTGSREKDEHDEKGERVLRCRLCETEITRNGFRVSRNEKHLHTFFNPAGIVYEIACFRDASGCLVQGTSSNEFSWFRGYGWQICLCISCLEHLGWYFSADNDTFFGLIVNRLKED